MARRSEKPVQTPGLFDDVQEARPAPPANPPTPPNPPAPPESGAKASSREGASERAGEATRPVQKEAPAALTVGQLTTRIKERLLELGRIRVEGEITGFKRHTSGHVYFDLKDEGARIACVIWRSTVARGLAFEPKEGDQVLAVGRLDVYEPRGNYKLIVDRLEPLGIGALLAQLEQRKAELAARGWFARQRALPRYPERVGVVTSRDGAALRDFLRTRSLRWPGYPLRLCHAPMQGPGAATQIAQSIARLDASGVDVIVICRGGGSLEDLWAFNELPVAEAIWNCGVPVISGVGHESDTTLADLVADHRAHTPTDAAQTILPDLHQLRSALARSGNYLMEAMERTFARRSDQLGVLSQRPVLRDARWILDARHERLGSLRARLQPSLSALHQVRANRLATLQTRLERRSPQAALEDWRRRLGLASTRLIGNSKRILERAEHRLGQSARTLEVVSPLAVLGRGYSLTIKLGDKAPLKDIRELAVGDQVETRLSQGTFRSRVEEVLAADAEPDPEPKTKPKIEPEDRD